MSDKCVFFHCYIAFSALVTQTNVSQIYIFLIIHLLNNDKFLQNYGQQQTSTVHGKTLPASKSWAWVPIKLKHQP